MKRTLRAGAAVLAAGLGLLATGCTTMTVNRLLAEPNRYNNRDVTLSGDVLKSVSVLGHGAYQLDDGTGKLWIVSSHGVPRQGARVKVTGRVRDVVDLGRLIPLPPEVGSGLVMQEKDHRAK
jgi:membrane protein implicated in regulation of membrane protease activity